VVVLRLRAIVIMLVGTPVMAGLLVGTIVCIVRMWGTSLLDTGFWLGAAVSCVLSTIALGIMLKARARVRETGEQTFMALLARFTPFLMVGGVIAGAVAAHFMVEGALANHRVVMEMECRTYVGEGQSMAACLPAMDRCDLEVRGTGGLQTDRRGNLPVEWPEGLYLPDEARMRARFLCVWKRLNPSTPGD